MNGPQFSHVTVNCKPCLDSKEEFSRYIGLSGLAEKYQSLGGNICGGEKYIFSFTHDKKYWKGFLEEADNLESVDSISVAHFPRRLN